MKAKELAELLLEYPDFDVGLGFVEDDDSEWGQKYKRFIVTGIADIRHSSKKIILDSNEI